MMGRVYQSAQQVLIWLGSCSQERSLGIDGLEALAKIPPNQRPLCPLAEYMLSPDDAYQEKLAGVPFTLVAETAMHLVNRQSFKRTWVLQEFFLAQQVIFSYGDRYISMNAILAAFDWTFGTVNSSTGRNGNHIVSKKRLALLWAPHAKRMQTILLARSGFTSGHRLTLREWLWASQGRLAEDGRDFIFGGLSLIDPGSLKIKKTILQNTIFDPKDQDSLPTSSSHIPRGLWSVLAADYTASEQEVLVNLMACLFSSANPYPLDVLSLAARPPYRPSSRERSGIEPPPGDYPSCNSPRLNLCKTLSVNKQGISSLFHAAGAAGGDGQTFAAGLIQPSPSPQISCDGRMLFLDVALIDRICHIVDLEIFVNQSEVGKLSVFLEFLARLPRFYQGGLQTSFDAVATTLTSTLSSTTPLFPTSPGIPKDFNVRSGSFISVLDSPAPECLCEILEREIRIWIHTLREHTEVPDQGAKSARDKKEVESHLESM
ncbi:hypothetical protein N7493_001509 [Penicillium malachiteum]|uniref:Heterokaryon incompatibility domain-containing protein n=1 Tax=Penicillium malachiteum TaxID=1324776 RepID=A0AAD6HUW0_9EURO|nr:hypothetical protein N7493_001509 [Penicillium malachiteum]